VGKNQAKQALNGSSKGCAQARHKGRKGGCGNPRGGSTATEKQQSRFKAKKQEQPGRKVGKSVHK